MTQKADHNEPATKGDIYMLEDRIVELFSDALQLIADQFEKQNKILATKADKKDIARLERKLEKTTSKTDATTKKLQRLKRAVA